MSDSRVSLDWMSEYTIDGERAFYEICYVATMDLYLVYGRYADENSIYIADKNTILMQIDIDNKTTMTDVLLVNDRLFVTGYGYPETNDCFFMVLQVDIDYKKYIILHEYDNIGGFSLYNVEGNVLISCFNVLFFMTLINHCFLIEKNSIKHVMNYTYRII